MSGKSYYRVHKMCTAIASLICIVFFLLSACSEATFSSSLYIDPDKSNTLLNISLSKQQAPQISYLAWDSCKNQRMQHFCENQKIYQFIFIFLCLKSKSGGPSFQEPFIMFFLWHLMDDPHDVRLYLMGNWQSKRDGRETESESKRGRGLYGIHSVWWW